MAMTPGRSLVAIYPGSFDPITNGHLDLIERASRLVDRLIVSLLRNERKQPLFSVQERLEMLREVTAGYENVEVDFFEGLLVDHAASRNAGLIIRGIRAISDYEYEWQMALMNRHLNPGLETVFLAPAVNLAFVSSTLVREVAQYGGDLGDLVDPVVADALRKRFAK